MALNADDLRKRFSGTAGVAGSDQSEPGGTATLVPAAVLIPLLQRPEGINVLLTRRSAHLSHHPGQISFPGGRIEAADAGPEAAALRESEEEVGMRPAQVEVLGRLPDYPTVTGFVISPVVGLVHPPLEWVPDPFEVAEIFEVPLAFLLDPHNHQRHEVVFGGRLRHYWAMPWGDYYIWGATAGILLMLCSALDSGKRLP